MTVRVTSGKLCRMRIQPFSHPCYPKIARKLTFEASFAICTSETHVSFRNRQRVRPILNNTDTHEAAFSRPRILTMHGDFGAKNINMHDVGGWWENWAVKPSNGTGWWVHEKQSACICITRGREPGSSSALSFNWMCVIKWGRVGQKWIPRVFRRFDSWGL